MAGIVALRPSDFCQKIRVQAGFGAKWCCNYRSGILHRAAKGIPLPEFPVGVEQSAKSLACHWRLPTAYAYSDRFSIATTEVHPLIWATASLRPQNVSAVVGGVSRCSKTSKPTLHLGFVEKPL
jgi:hypothetical protein